MNVAFIQDDTSCQEQASTKELFNCSVLEMRVLGQLAISYKGTRQCFAIRISRDDLPGLVA
jgi:hypothetical protein